MAKGKKKFLPAKRPPSETVSIVIPVFGRFDLLKRCLDAIPASCTCSYSVVLIDNNSPNKDEAKKFYEENRTQYQYLAINKGNTGFAPACNQGARATHSEYILFLNSDVILAPGSLDVLLNEMKNDPKVGIAGMLLTFPDYAGDLFADIRPGGKVQHVGMEMDHHANFRHVYVGWNSEHPKVQARRDSYAVTGAALLISRNVFKKVRGFDVQYVGGTWEDVDLCLAVRDIGYNVIVVPKARGVHYTGASAESYKIKFPMTMNYQKFIMKWQGKLNYTMYLYC